MKQFNDDTQKIINAHKGDFNCTNYQQILQEAGGYKKYVQSLGGVFSKYLDFSGTIRTVLGFQDVAEYVFGLMSIYGFDYNNYKTYIRWGGGSPFYVNGEKGKCTWGKIDDLCGKSSKGKTTNCNFGIDSFLFKTGLFGQKGQPDNCCAFKYLAKNFPVIRQTKDLQIGDLIQFFHSSTKSNNPDDWKGWGHVCVVGDIVDGQIILFDAGGRFIGSGDYKHVFKVNSNNKPVGEYNNYEGWIGNRCFNLIGAKADLDMSNTDLAVAVIHGDYGTGQDRVDLLGSRYHLTQTLVNHFLTENHHSDYILACSMFVLAGHAGNGEDRKNYFGSIYQEVQDRVNRLVTDADVVTVEQLALQVINGKWGSGLARKTALTEAGYNYQDVQNKVNTLLS